MMLTLKVWAVTIAMTFAPTWFKPGENPETTPQFEARVHTMGTAVAAEVKAVIEDQWLQQMYVLAVLQVWHSETSFHVHVHSGKLNGDPYLSVNGRARCLGQIHKDDRMTYREWKDLAGTSLAATRRCAKKSLRKFRGAMSACTDGQWTEANVARAMRRYQLGNGCKATKHSKERAKRWRARVGRVRPIAA